TGIPVATLDCYLGARATVPSVEAAVKIAQALRVSVEYLVIGGSLNLEKTQKKHFREAHELVQLIDNLNHEQCKAILNLMRTFKNSTVNHFHSF
ncbi:MAG: XRE family transcriptional regulator, partial [Treponema sp.]|nr:XRE family transcriptional regulator [Treponema sp.]